MGSFFEPELLSEGKKESLGFDEMITNYLQSLPGREAPETPISQQAAGRMQQSIGMYGPQMEQFYGGMMRHGGLQDTLGLGRDLHRQSMEDSIANIMSQGRGGTANMRALGRETGRGAQEFALGTARESQRNKYMGAQGIGGMPGYYAQPSSVEQAMFGMQMPYDLANMGAESSLMNILAGENWYPPNVVYGPSPFDQFLGPLLGSATQIGTGYAQGYGQGVGGKV